MLTIRTGVKEKLSGFDYSMKDGNILIQTETTATRDLSFNNMAILSTTGKFNVNGFKIYVKNLLITEDKQKAVDHVFGGSKK